MCVCVHAMGRMMGEGKREGDSRKGRDEGKRGRGKGSMGAYFLK